MTLMTLVMVWCPFTCCTWEGDKETTAHIRRHVIAVLSPRSGEAIARHVLQNVHRHAHD